MLSKLVGSSNGFTPGSTTQSRNVQRATTETQMRSVCCCHSERRSGVEAGSAHAARSSGPWTPTCRRLWHLFGTARGSPVKETAGLPNCPKPPRARERQNRSRSREIRRRFSIGHMGRVRLKNGFGYVCAAGNLCSGTRNSMDSVGSTVSTEPRCLQVKHHRTIGWLEPMAADCQTKLGPYDLARHAPRHLNGQSPAMRAALSRKESAPCKTRQLTEEGPTKLYSLPGPPKCPLTEPFWSVIVGVCGKPLQQWRPRGSEEQVQLQYARHILWALNALFGFRGSTHTHSHRQARIHTRVS